MDAMLSKPPKNVNFVINYMKNHYNFEVKNMKELNGFEDRNYYVITTDSKEFIFKTSNAFESANKGVLEAFNAVILHLHNNGFRVTVPILNNRGNYVTYEPIPATDKNSEQLTQISDNVYGIRLLEFIPGKILLDVAFTPELLRQCGQMLAKITIALETFESPFLRKRKSASSLLSIQGIRQFLDALNDPLDQKIVSETLDEFSTQVIPLLSDLEYGYIHGDFNEQNIIVDINTSADNDEKYAVKGIIDFGDIQYAPKVFDLAVHLAYTMLEFKAAEPILAPGFGLSGYLQFRKLNPKELSVLYVCIKGRLCSSLVAGTHAYRLNPTNPYFISSAKKISPILRALHESDANDILNKWLNIDKQFI